MPEFRFRRKKKKQQSSRRHTVHDAEKAQAQVAAAREMVNRGEAAAATNVSTRSPSIGDPNDIPEPVPMAAMTDGGHIVSTGTLAREREKFFDLLRSKYPEHDRGVEEFLSTDDTALDKHGRGRRSRSQSVDIETMLSLQITSEEDEEGERGGGRERGLRGAERGGGRERGLRETEREGGRRRRGSLSSLDAKEAMSEPENVHHHYGGCLFLRHSKELRRCPMPSPVTVSTLKNLLVNTFDLQRSLLDDPASYVMIQDRGSMRWTKLTNTSDVYDHCILQLADPDAPSTNPTHFVKDTMLEDHTYSSSESPPPVVSNHPPPSPPSAHRHYNQSSHLTTPLHSPAWPQLDAHYYAEPSATDTSMWQSGTASTAPLSPPHVPTLPPSPPHPSTATLTTTAPVQFGSPHSVTSSTSGVCSESLQTSISPLTISRHVRVLERRVRELRQDCETIRREQQSEMAEFGAILSGTSCKILATIRGHARVAALGKGVSVEPFRRERLELTEEKTAYRRHADDTVLEVSILESAVEDIRRDVVVRRCRVHEREVDGLVGAVQKTLKAISQAKDQYQPLEAKMKRVMERELTDIVEEEKFIQDEYPRLEESGEKCLRLTNTLETLKQVAVVQFHRTPLVPHFAPVANPNRAALLDTIKAVTPNHTHRVESIEMAECVQHKKKELVMQREGVKRFESQLRMQREHLHKMESKSDLEDRQAKRAIRLYLEEKAEREAELAREIKLERTVAERKRKEEREKMKKRLQRQREDDKKMQRRREGEKKKMQRQRGKKVVERLKNGEGEAGEQESSQSVAGEDENGEWYHQEIEEGSIRFSSSFSSTASLLEHVRSLGGWSSDNTSLQEQNSTTAPKENGSNTSAPEERQSSELEDHKHTSTEARCDKNRSNSHQTSERESSTLDETSGADEVRNHSGFKPKPPQKQSGDNGRGKDQLQVASGKSQKTAKKKKVQTETRLPQSNADSNGLKTKQQKAQSLPRDNPPKSKYESPQLKTATPRLQTLNNEARGTQSPTTGLQAALRTNQTRSPLPHKQTNQTVRGRITQTAKAPTKFQRHRAPLNDVVVAASPPGRHVASSEALLDDHHHQQIHNGTAKAPLSSTATSRLANTPSKVRKSIGYMGEFENQAGIYDLLEKKPEKKRRSRKDDRLDKGFQTPTFDPQVRPDNDPELQELELLSPHANSQPDNFEFMSNPSYESRMEARDTAEPKAKSRSLGRSDPVNQQNGHLPTNTGGVRQSYMPTSKMPTAVVIDSGVPRNTKMQQVLRGSSRGWLNSESDSSETGRVQSVLSDHSTMTHSSVTHQSVLSAGQQSISSGRFSSGSRSNAPPTSIKLHSHVTSRPLVPQPHTHGETHSGLPVLIKPYHPRGDETGTGRSRQHVAPHHPPHRQTTRVPMQTVRDDTALTSYPRFQSREDHTARLHHENQPNRRHRTKHQLGVLPGTGQLAHVSKPHPDHAHHLLHPAKNNRHPDRAGSLV